MSKICCNFAAKFKRNVMDDFVKPIELIVPIGLPGSGKTTYCMNYVSSHVRGACYFSFDDSIVGKHGDEIRRTYPGCDFETLVKFAKYQSQNGIGELMRNFGELLLDGPWFTRDIVEKFVNAVVSVANETGCVRIAKIRFVYFNENRELCCINDEGRRDTNSRITIMHTDYVKISDDFINRIAEISNADVSVEYRDVVKKTTFDVAAGDIVSDCELERFHDMNIDRSGIIRSERWSAGGMWMTGDSSGDIDSEDPVPFKEFDTFVHRVCPNISKEDYDKLFESCCEIDNFSECEESYYGGYEYFGHWECDLCRLKSKMNELKLI